MVKFLALMGFDLKKQVFVNVFSKFLEKNDNLNLYLREYSKTQIKCIFDLDETSVIRKNEISRMTDWLIKLIAQKMDMLFKVPETVILPIYSANDNLYLIIEG